MSLKKLKTEEKESFGQRLARLRKVAGYSQRDLAKEIGISHRVVAYYEKETNNPPGTLLPLWAKALNVTTDILLGVEPYRDIDNKQKDIKLWRQFKQIEKLPKSERHQISKLIDKFLELDSLKKTATEKTL
ncbi:helix-turn-helix domain-containing protein [bacterium]|nr:helix-turn-helix domain-containing protein [bacterium]